MNHPATVHVVDDDVSDGEGIVGGALRERTVGGQQVVGAQGGGGVGFAGEGRGGEDSEASEHGHVQDTSVGMHSIGTPESVEVGPVLGPGLRCPVPVACRRVRRLCCATRGNVMLHGNRALNGFMSVDAISRDIR